MVKNHHIAVEETFWCHFCPHGIRVLSALSFIEISLAAKAWRSLQRFFEER
jgi:hypothetical protein